MKACRRCVRVLPVAEFYSLGSGKLCSVCKECFKAYRKVRYHTVEKHDTQRKARLRACGARWYNRDVEVNRAKRASKDRKKREACIAAYGGRCGCCGESRYEFLALDHVNGGGNKERKQTPHVHRRLFSLGFPAGYRILCHNCNMSIGFYGYCPHEVVEEDAACG